MLLNRAKDIKIIDVIVKNRIRAEVGDLTELKESISDRGLINPITVEQKDDKYILLAGMRRLQAVKDLGYGTIRATIYKDLDTIDHMYIELDENNQRENFTYAEEVALKKKIFDLEKKIKPDTSIRSMAKKIDMSKSSLSTDLMLAEAIEFMPELGKFGSKHEALKKFDQIEAKLVEQVMHSKLKDTINKGTNKTISIFEKLYKVGDTDILLKQETSMKYDLVELDPPYGIKYDTIKKDSLKGASYKDVTPTEYKKMIGPLVSECYRVLKASGWLVLWFSMKYYPETAQALKDAGFNFDPTPIHWNKTKGKSHHPTTMLSQAIEHCFYARKGQATLNIKGQINIITAKQEEDNVFATPKSIEMYQKLFKLLVPAGSRILSPYLGSGNPILGAYLSDMLCTGYDLFEENKNNFLLKCERYV